MACRHRGALGRREHLRRQGVARGKPELLAHDIDVRDELRHAVLDLETCVHLEKPEAPVPIEEELRRRGVGEPDRPRRSDRHLVKGATLRLVQERSRGLLDELLMTALQRAVTLPDGHDRAVGIAEQLDLDVARGVDLALEIHGAVTEGRQCFRSAGGESGGQLVGYADPAHPAAPTPRGRLHEQGEPDRLSGLDNAADGIGSIGDDRLEGPGQDRDAGCGHRPSGRDLVAERGDGRARRTDEDDPGLLDRTGERGSLGEEAVAGMDRGCPCCDRGVDDRVRPEVRLARRSGAETNGPIGSPDVGGVDVGVAVDGHRFDAELAAGPEDANGDLAPVRDGDPRERRLPSPVLAQRRDGGIRCHRGMFPCFFGGLLSRLSASRSRARISRRRVSDGRITSST